jgi:hypothetical protein
VKGDIGVSHAGLTGLLVKGGDGVNAGSETFL